IGPANVLYVRIRTEQGGNTVIPITTTQSEDEIRTLVEDYIEQNEKGRLDYAFRVYVEEKGYQTSDLMLGSALAGKMVNTKVLLIYK
ncbi:MAG: hypothetical protein LUQ24_05630, partial [Methanobacterium sp.]|nr:hypothetical protein [Methanobacterium sp.]